MTEAARRVSTTAETMTVEQMVEEVIGRFVQESPHCDAATTDDARELGFEWRFRDGTKFWIGVERNGEMLIYYRPGNVSHGNGRTFRFVQKPNT